MTLGWLSHLSIRTRLFCALGLLFGVVMSTGIISHATLMRADRQLDLLHTDTLVEVAQALELSQSAASLSKSAPFLLSLNPPFGISTEADAVYAAIGQLEIRAQGDADLGLAVAKMRAAVTELVAIIPQQNRISTEIEAITANLEGLLRKYRLWTTTRSSTVYERQAWSALQQLAMEGVGTARATTLISIGEFQRRYAKIRADILAAATPVMADNVQDIDRTIIGSEALFSLVYRNLAISLDAESALFRIRTEAERINALASLKVQAASLRLQDSRAQTSAELTLARYAIFALMAFGSLIALISAVFVSRYVARNLRQIAGAMRRLASGDRRTRIARMVETRDEIGQLFAAFRIFRANALKLDRNSRLIQRQNNLFSRVFENINDGVVITAASGKIVAENARTRALLRLPPAVPEVGATNLEALIAQSGFEIKETAATAAGYWEYESPSGNVLELRRSLFPEGGAVYLFTEITERRLIDERLSEIRRVETLGKVTGEVAHDFGNILSTISGNLHLLETALPETSGRLLARIEDAVDLGVTLTERLLAFARKQHLAPQNTDIAELVGAMTNLLEIALPDTAELIVSTPDEPMVALVDPGQLESAILNLCVNAAQAIVGRSLSAQTVQGRIKIDVARNKDGHVILKVGDNGHGMTAETLRYAAEPFFSARHDGSGTGLGLSMVHGFVHQSGGTIQIESQVDHGTTVTLSFPPADAAQHSQIQPHFGPGLRVLVVDDDPAALAAISRALEHFGFAVTRAPDFQTGYAQLVQEGQFDLLLTDLALDNHQSGWDLVKLALKCDKNSQNQMRIIAMSTGLPGFDPVPPAEHYRFGRLAKPISSDVLAATLTQIGLPKTG